MTRKVFYSFHYKADSWRASKIRNIGAIEDNAPASDNDWETIWRGGDAAIERWIKAQMKGRKCTIVLIGAETAGRPWIDYEIKESWSQGMGLLGIHIHNLTNHSEQVSKMGANPFSKFTLGQQSLSNIVKTYNPPYSASKDVRNYIAANLALWIEDAIAIRNRH